ncbi:MAG: hypothetical protein KDB14_26560, partial [Planctomycetales bacterium]|nr:hypothetical protein [Planctomycetales bacterium]
MISHRWVIKLALTLVITAPGAASAKLGFAVWRRPVVATQLSAAEAMTKQPVQAARQRFLQVYQLLQREHLALGGLVVPRQQRL